MSERRFTIAVDAMGGDFAPAAVVDGVLRVAENHPDDIAVILVGDERRIHDHAPVLAEKGGPVSVYHASQVIEMSDSPVEALKKKRDSSIAVIAGLLKHGKADAIFSAGNTGAHMAASLFAAGRIEGVARPTIGTFYPHPEGETFLLDVGANIDCKANHLFQFGLMGSIFVKYFSNVDDPRVGLLSIGEEPTKGNAATIEANRLFSESALHFVGNIEGGDLNTDKADVVVCDGFIGNILLKLFESYGDTAQRGLEKILGGGIAEKIGSNALNEAFDTYKDQFNYEIYGGLPLLGLDGISIIGHGRSSARAVESAVYNAKKVFEDDITGRIRKAMERYKEND